MGANAELLREVFERRSFEEFVGLFADDAEWVWWEPSPACRSKAAIVQRMNEVRAEGIEAHPEIVLDAGDRVVVDPRTDPPLDWAPELHHVYTFSDGKVVYLEDFPDRSRAIAAAVEP
jgi:ketosteroid isomerase-like protein